MKLFEICLLLGTVFLFTACSTHKLVTTPVGMAAKTTFKTAKLSAKVIKETTLTASKAVLAPFDILVPDNTQVGMASWYGEDYHGKRTTSGEVYDMYKLTAAHCCLPLGTRVKVTNLTNGKSVTVRIIDRGPFKKDRIIDLSFVAAKEIGLIGHGTERVSIKVIKK